MPTNAVSVQLSNRDGTVVYFLHVRRGTTPCPLPVGAATEPRIRVSIRASGFLLKSVEQPTSAEQSASSPTAKHCSTGPRRCLQPESFDHIYRHRDGRLPAGSSVSVRNAWASASVPNAKASTPNQPPLGCSQLVPYAWPRDTRVPRRADAAASTLPAAGGRWGW